MDLNSATNKQEFYSEGDPRPITPTTPAPQLLKRLFLLDIVNVNAGTCNSYTRDGSFGLYTHGDITAAFKDADDNNRWSTNAPSGDWVTGQFDIDLSTQGNVHRGEGVMIAFRLKQSIAQFASSTMAISAGDTFAEQDFYNLNVWPYSTNAIKYAWFSATCKDYTPPEAYNLSLLLNGAPHDIDPKIKNDGYGSGLTSRPGWAKVSPTTKLITLIERNA
jgi:hypothetical protein